MKFSRILRACLVTVAVVGTSAYAATFHLKMGHTANKNDTQHATAEKMVELIEQRTKGDVNIAIFPAGQLGNDAAIINGVRGGTIDIVFNGASNYNGIVPNTAALELPFVFRSARHAYNVLDGAVGQSVLNELTPHGIKGLAYWESGWRAFTNNKHPITKPDDLKGLKIRSTPNPYHIQAFKLLGMNPSPMPITELYTALENGTFDAQEHPITLTWSSKFYEVQKYLTVSNHVFTPVIVVMNKDKFNSLPTNYQKIVVDAAREAAKYQRDLNARNAATVLADLKKHMHVLENVDMAPFKKIVSAEIAKTFAEKNDPALLKAIEDTK